MPVTTLFKFSTVALIFSAVIFSVSQTAEASSEKLELRLPTKNDYLFRGAPAKFFAPTVSGRLISGQYGFTRSSREPPRIFDRFHEGIDVRPLRRDRNGDPLDPILAAADGVVAHVTSDPTKSNYGHYIVLRHPLGEYDVYTLYAHNARNLVSRGQHVKAGDRIAIMGYTGRGINQQRAHLHFEVGFMLNKNFPSWFEERGKRRPDDKNHHRELNGINLLGIDPVPLLRATRAGRPMTVKQIFESQKPCYKIRIPATRRPIDFQRRFDFLTRGGVNQKRPVSWEVTCNQVGLPLKFEPSSRRVSSPEAIWFDYSRSIQDSLTIGRVLRRTSSQGPRIMDGGRSFFDLLMWRP